MRLILIFLLLTSSLLQAQRLDAWLVKGPDENPETYLAQAKNRTANTPTDVAGNFFLIARSYHNLNQEDTALKYYFLAKKEFEKLNLEEPAKDLSLEIHKVISSQENYDKYGNSFLDEYFDYAKKTKSNDRLANSWNEFGKNFYTEFDFDKRSNPQVLSKAEEAFKKGIQFAGKTENSRIKAKLYGNLGALENTRQNYITALNYLDTARTFILELGDSYELFVNYYNYGNNYFSEGNFKEAIAWFKKAEIIAIPKFRGKSKRLLYKKLMQSYDEVNDQPNRKVYQKLFEALDHEIKDREQNIAIHDINVKYQVAEKDQQISSLEQFKDKFHKNRLIFGILLFLVFLLALYSFVRWKKLDYTKQRLEAEKDKIQEEKLEIEEQHIRTVEELEKVKNIVTEGFILLKDKTKIYLNDLMYVKSEDHYLNLFGSDGKKHFVRGKLAEIMLELPPNFVKCQRSYIVNTNYIHSVHQGMITLKNKEEIPVSRGFKL